MEWTRSETLALAQQSCIYCFGLGLRPGRNGKSAPCNCVFRAIFRACYARFEQCADKAKYISRVSMVANRERQRKVIWGLKDEEFIADFCLAAKRTLTPAQHKLFRLYMLLRADWSACCQKLKMERGAFFHEVYRIEQKLGKAFREMEPYPLFPVDEYFHGNRRIGPAAPAQPARLKLRKRLKVPLAKAKPDG